MAFICEAQKARAWSAMLASLRFERHDGMWRSAMAQHTRCLQTLRVRTERLDRLPPDVKGQHLLGGMHPVEFFELILKLQLLFRLRLGSGGRGTLQLRNRCWWVPLHILRGGRRGGGVMAGRC